MFPDHRKMSRESEAKDDHPDGASDHSGPLDPYPVTFPHHQPMRARANTMDTHAPRTRSRANTMDLKGKKQQSDKAPQKVVGFR